MKVKLESVIKRVEGKVNAQTTDFKYYLGKGHGESGEIAITQHGDLEKDRGTLGMAFRFSFRKGDFLFMSRSFANRKAGMAMFDGICSEKTFVFRTKDESILLQNYLPFIFQSEVFWQHCDDNKAGGVNNFINWSTLANYEFSLPPLSEQKALAEKLWAAYEVKQSYLKMITATEEMVKSQFVEMFGGKETAPIANYVKDSFPGEWGTEDVNETGVKVIRTTNFTNNGKLNLAEVVTRNIDQKKIDKKQIKKYDTILERSGGTNDNPVGRVVLFEEDGLFLSNNFTQILRFKDIDPRFAFYSLFFFYQLNKIKIRSMGAKTTGIQNLNMKKYLEIEIPKVSIAEQQQFVRIAEQADKSEFELKKSIAAIDGVIKSLINEKL